MKNYNIILAAGKPFMGESSTIIKNLFFEGKLLEWLLGALNKHENKNNLLVTGDLESVAHNSMLSVIKENKLWYETGALFSLKIALDSVDISVNDSFAICYGDILVRPSVIQQVDQCDTECVVVYDSEPNMQVHKKIENIYVVDSTLKKVGYDLPKYYCSGQYAGLVKINGKVAFHLKQFLDNNIDQIKQLTIIDLLEWVRCQEYSINCIDAKSHWAEVDDPKSIVQFVFGTKAETLSRLQPMLTSANIVDQVSFTFEDWHKDKAGILATINDHYKHEELIIRSSARSEDSFEGSNAGAYCSLLNVKVDETLDLSIDEVFASYGQPQNDDQVLVQKMLKDVAISGVAFTRSLEKNAPYYVVNYDESGSTESITSGQNINAKTLYVFKECPNAKIPKKLVSLITALKELEKLLSYDALDVEFAYTKDGQLYILQVRPLVCDAPFYDQFDPAISQMIQANINAWGVIKSQNNIQIHGDHPLYGVMPDWNPAEIIGTNPHALSLSLYNDLIMNETWATQRAEFGYKDVRPQRLLKQFSGKPYVDVRASFNSFTPASMSSDETGLLVNYYVDTLIKNPSSHDKIEFEVVPTCYGPAFDLWRDKLRNEGKITDATLDALEVGLKNISQHAIESIDSYFQKVGVLEKRIHSHLAKDFDHISMADIRNLLDECRIFGTLPFAHLARCGFVAVTFLKEGVQKNWLSQSAFDSFMGTISTVSKEFSLNIQKVADDQLSMDAFVQQYGHLRPGTYEITSESYRENVEKYLKPLLAVGQEKSSVQHSEDSSVWHTEKTGFFSQLRNIGLEYADEILESFLVRAIEGREISKFIFSKELSLALEWIKHLGQKLSLSISDLSHVSLNELETSCRLDSPEAQREYLLARRRANKTLATLSSKCELPELLYSSDQFECFEINANLPNYIGNKVVVRDVVYLNTQMDSSSLQLEDKIVMIEQADPGYDWLFGQNIAGLITMYGGANSHMAIRSAELGLTAAIGAGEVIFNQAKQAQLIELNPNDKVIRILSS